MSFFKKLFNKAPKQAAADLAKQAGLDPKIIMPKIFNYFCQGQKGADGKPGMDFSKLLAFATQTGLLQKCGLDKGKLGGIFSKFMGGAGGGGGAAPAAPAAPAGGDGGAGGGEQDDPKGTLNFDDFQKGMTEIAEDKFKDEGIKGEKALNKLEQQIIADNDVSDWME